VQDIGAIMGDVTRKQDASSAETPSSLDSDAVSLIRGVLKIARQKKVP
jgi:hypothetical protein